MLTPKQIDHAVAYFWKHFSSHVPQEHLKHKAWVEEEFRKALERSNFKKIDIIHLSTRKKNAPFKSFMNTLRAKQIIFPQSLFFTFSSNGKNTVSHLEFPKKKILKPSLKAQAYLLNPKIEMAGIQDAEDEIAMDRSERELEERVLYSSELREEMDIQNEEHERHCEDEDKLQRKLDFINESYENAEIGEQYEDALRKERIDAEDSISELVDKYPILREKPELIHENLSTLAVLNKQWKDQKIRGKLALTLEVPKKN